MTQTRTESLIETTADIGTGFFIAWALTIYLAQHFDIHDPEHAFYFTLIFTVVSIARRYLFRRLFNQITKRKLSNADV